MPCFCRFPLNRKELLAKWIKAIKRDNFEPKSTTFICSVHFSESCLRRYALNVHLKEDAVPSIFDFKSHLQKKKRDRRPRRALRQETVPSVSTMEDFPATLTSLMSEDHKMLQENVHKGQQAQTYEVVPSKLLTPDLPTTSASYSCDVSDESLHIQDSVIKCEHVLPTPDTPHLPTTSASFLCFDAHEGTVEKTQIKYLAVPIISTSSVKSEFPATSAVSLCDEGAGVQQSSITYRVEPLASARPNFSAGSVAPSSNDTEIRSAQNSVTKMHTYAAMTSPDLIKLKYEQLLQYEKQRYKELYKRLQVAQRCLHRRKKRMEIMKNTIKQLNLKINQGSATSMCEKRCGNLTATM